MKFSNSDSLKMGRTVLPILLVCILFNSWLGCCHCDQKKDSPKDRPKDQKVMLSDMITWRDAIVMQDDYLNPKTAPNPLKLLAGSKFQTLLGFQFDAAQLSDIIYDKTDLTWKKQVDKVMFYFGTDGIYTVGVGPATTREPIMHLIAVGVNKDTLVIPGSPKDQNDRYTCRVSQADIYPPTSQRISWTQALQLKADYLNASTNPHFIKKLDNARTSFITLEGFLFDADQLSAIIYANNSSLDKSAADHIMLYFGAESAQGTDGVTKEPVMHLIAVGVNKDKANEYS